MQDAGRIVPHVLGMGGGWNVPSTQKTFPENGAMLGLAFSGPGHTYSLLCVGCVCVCGDCA